jgi:hypothetical protein
MLLLHFKEVRAVTMLSSSFFDRFPNRLNKFEQHSPLMGCNHDLLAQSLPQNMVLGLEILHMLSLLAISGGGQHHQ